ncbi:MAG: cell division protein ZapA [Bacteroidales bacterium]
MDELKITVVIADRSYRLTIERNEEEGVRKAANEINKKVKQYSENYAFNDKQDLLAMVALEKTTAVFQKNEILTEHEQESMKELNEIEILLEKDLVDY